VIEIYIGDHTEADLDFIQSNPLYETNDSDLIRAFWEQLAVSEDAKWSLTKWKTENSSPHFNVSAIASMQQSGYNLYRLRPLSKRLKKYRIIYAYNGQIDEVYLLAVVVKKPDPEAESPMDGGYEYYDYEPTHRITQRVLNEYDKLGLPKRH
jgi:hypothetical protein